MEARAPADDVLDSLTALGDPEDGWWSMLQRVRAATPRAIALALPRPGDPRGVALPRREATGGLVGWSNDAESVWLLPVEHGWLTLEGTAFAPTDTAEADRALREAIVHAAHAIDGLPVSGPAALSGSAIPRDALESCVGAWLDPRPHLPAPSRELAGRGLRMLLSIEPASSGMDVSALERAARTAVEAAYSTTLVVR